MSIHTWHRDGECAAEGRSPTHNGLSLVLQDGHRVVALLHSADVLGKFLLCSVGQRDVFPKRPKEAL